MNGAVNEAPKIVAETTYLAGAVVSPTQVRVRSPLLCLELFELGTLFFLHTMQLLLTDLIIGISSVIECPFKHHAVTLKYDSRQHPGARWRSQ